MDRTLLPVPADDPQVWAVDRLDIDAYFDRIGYTGPRTATVETLRAVHRAHAASITWEIVESALGGRMSLDLPALQKKICEDGEGGCCLESNLLFAAALQQLGFPLSRQISRVRRGSGRVRTRSHLVLLVEVEGGTWMADPGFGDESLLEPVAFADGATVTVGGWTWRLDDDGGDWVLRCLHPDGWFDVYAFRVERNHPIDFEMIVHFSYVDPGSVFRGQLIAQRGDEKVRHVLKNQVLTTTVAGGPRESRELSGDEVVETLRTVFAIPVGPGDAQALRDRFTAV